jgi:catechol 2,3-dioxygenase-like lactoylglutathione lyase family enzyme
MKYMVILACTASAMLSSCAASDNSIDPRPLVTAASPDVIRGVHHVGITVSNIDATLAFYQKAVNYEVVERRIVPASTLPAEILDKRTGNIEIALIRTPTAFLELTDIDPGLDAAPNRKDPLKAGYTHICWQTPATDPGYERFSKIGLEMLTRGDKPADIGGYGVTYAYGFDADGTMIEMEQVDSPRRSESDWLTHIATATGDIKKMAEFYAKLLGYEPYRTTSIANRKVFDDIVDVDNVALTGTWFALWNFELEFWHFDNPKTAFDASQKNIDTIGYNSVSFEVTDLDGTVERLRTQGIDWAGEAFETNGWKIRYARDPEGKLLAFQERTSADREMSMEDMRWHDPKSYRNR